MKQVRIDNRTIIEVDNSIPDELARKRYLKRVKENRMLFDRTFQQRKKPIK